jgi:hypothetical protein
LTRHYFLKKTLVAANFFEDAKQAALMNFLLLKKQKKHRFPCLLRSLNPTALTKFKSLDGPRVGLPLL